MTPAFSCATFLIRLTEYWLLWHCWLGGRKGIRRGKMGGWWRWRLVGPDGVAPSLMVSMSASVNLSLHHKVQKSSSGTGSPGWSQKKGCKMVVCVCVCVCVWVWVLTALLLDSALHADCVLWQMHSYSPLQCSVVGSCKWHCFMCAGVLYVNAEESFLFVPCPLSSVTKMMTDSVARNFQLLFDYVCDDDARFAVCCLVTLNGPQLPNCWNVDV